MSSEAAMLAFGNLGWTAVIFLVGFALIGALFWVSVFSIYRAVRTRRWGWLIVILATWPIGLGWLTGAAFVFGVDRRDRRRAGQTPTPPPPDGSSTSG